MIAKDFMIDVHEQAYEAERDDVKELTEAEKSQHYNSKVQEYQGDRKKLFNIHVVDKLLNRGQPNTMPQHESSQQLLNILPRQN